MMHRVRFYLTLVLGTVLIPLATASAVVGQEQEARRCPGKLEALNASYVQQLRDIELRWMADLADLTDDSRGPGADAVYRQLFKLAIANDLCHEAQAAARKCLSSIRSEEAQLAAQSCTSSIPSGQDLRALAALVQVFGRAEKGEYERSLADFKSLFNISDSGAQPAAKSNAAIALAVGEAYL
jgi:hypothetical protein